MKAMLLPALFTFALATMLPAQTCREVVRDASGRLIGSSTAKGKCQGVPLFPVQLTGLR